MITSTSRREEVEGKIIKHRALFAGEHAEQLYVVVFFKEVDLCMSTYNLLRLV